MTGSDNSRFRRPLTPVRSPNQARATPPCRIERRARDSEIIRRRDNQVAGRRDFHDFEKQVHRP